MSFSFASMNKFSAALVVAGAIALPAAIAAAGNGAPDVSIEFGVGGNDPLVFNPMGSNVGGNVYNYAGNEVGEGWVFSYDLNADADPFISGNIVVQNVSFSDQTFDFTVFLPTSVLPSSLIGGSVAGGLTDNSGNGAALGLLDGNDSIWSAIIDGTTVATLLGEGAAAGAFESVSIGPEAFGTPIPSMEGPAVEDYMAINIAFELSAGASASFTSVFVAQVPAPAGLALLGVAGVVSRRRRRA